MLALSDVSPSISITIIRGMLLERGFSEDQIDAVLNEAIEEYTFSLLQTSEPEAEPDLVLPDGNDVIRGVAELDEQMRQEEREEAELAAKEKAEEEEELELIRLAGQSNLLRSSEESESAPVKSDVDVVFEIAMQEQKKEDEEQHILATSESRIQHLVRKHTDQDGHVAEGAVIAEVKSGFGKSEKAVAKMSQSATRALDVSKKQEAKHVVGQTPSGTSGGIKV